MTGYATREELAQIKGALKSGLSDIRLEMANMKGELEVKIGQLDVKISDVKSSVIRWVVLFFFVTMLFAILGLYFKK